MKEGPWCAKSSRTMAERGMDGETSAPCGAGYQERDPARARSQRRARRKPRGGNPNERPDTWQHARK